MLKSDAEFQLEHFTNAHDKLDYVSKLVQFSMDGPNVNWKLLDLFEEDRHDKNPDCPYLLQIGSCGLHVLHGAYQT